MKLEEAQKIDYINRYQFALRKQVHAYCDRNKIDRDRWGEDFTQEAIIGFLICMGKVDNEDQLILKFGKYVLRHLFTFHRLNHVVTIPHNKFKDKVKQFKAVDISEINTVCEDVAERATTNVLYESMTASLAKEERDAVYHIQNGGRIGEIKRFVGTTNKQQTSRRWVGIKKKCREHITGMKEGG